MDYELEIKSLQKCTSECIDIVDGMSRVSNTTANQVEAMVEFLKAMPEITSIEDTNKVFKVMGSMMEQIENNLLAKYEAEDKELEAQKASKANYDAPKPVNITPFGYETEETTNLKKFMSSMTPKKMYKELNKFIAGQEEMKNQVSLFYYYHLMRRLDPTLPPHAIMIAGPTGCGKTEIFRRLKKQYSEAAGDKIVIVSSQMISQDGWKGNYKFADVFKEFVDDNGNCTGGVIVFDEFDKLCRTKTSAGGENVAFSIQVEILKALEGDGFVVNNKQIDTSNIDFAFVGAFTDIFEEKTKTPTSLGFVTVETPEMADVTLTEEDFLDYGVAAELLGRITNYIVANKLEKKDYKKIIQNPNGRIAQLKKSLGEYVNIKQLNTDINSIIDEAYTKNLGVRSAQLKIEQEIIANLMTLRSGLKVKKLECPVYDSWDEDLDIDEPDPEYY